MPKASMRAVQFDRPGGPEVLQIRTVPAPVAGRREVVVRVHATSVNPADILARQVRFARFPRGTSSDFAGEVVEVGTRVDDLDVGARVWGWLGPTSGLRSTGAAADYVVIHRNRLAAAPATLDLVTAAALPLAGLTALHTLRDVLRLQVGQRLLVIGASGGVGSVAIQLGRAMGASVTAVASARNAEFCHELGADQVLDYATTADVPQREFDALVACHGASLRRYLQSVRLGGRAATLPADTFPFALRSWLFPGPRVRISVARPRGRDLAVLADYVDRGELRPVVEQVVPLEEIRDAHRAVESGHARGKRVVDLSREIQSQGIASTRRSAVASSASPVRSGRSCCR